MSALRVFLFGCLELFHGEEELPTPPTLKSQSLFAYLALHSQQPQPREKLAGLFWGDRPDYNARRSLTTALWQIRRCLPAVDEDWLQGDGNHVQLNPNANLWLDITDFEKMAASKDISSLQSAVDIYRAPLLSGFYHDWVLEERYRLDEIYSDVLTRMMDFHESAEDYQAALKIGLRLLEFDSLREDACLVVMRSLCRLGRRSAALEQYHRCKERLKQELDVDPIPEIKALYQSVVSGSFPVGIPVALEPVEQPAVPAPVGQHPFNAVGRIPFVGRDAQLNSLHASFDKARRGEGGLVLVHGEAGVGKTRLMKEFADQVSWKAVPSFWGRCYQFERLLPYQPFSEVLQSALGSIPDEKLADLPNWIQEMLVSLVPSLLPKVARGGQRIDNPPVGMENQLFEAAARLLEETSNAAPFVIILEDLHWAAESTLQLLHYLVRNLYDHPILFIGTLRPEALQRKSPFQSVAHQLRLDGLASSIILDCLSREDTDALVTQMSGCGPEVISLAQRLYLETEGNPFFLVEMIKSLFEAGSICIEEGIWQGDFEHVSLSELPLPEGVSEAIYARIARFEPQVLQVLQAAAVLGKEFDFDPVSAVSRLDEDSILEVLDFLLRHRLIDEGRGAQGRDYVFHHHKIQEVVYSGIPDKHRRYLHGRSAAVMEALFDSRLEELAGELAYHFHKARALNTLYEEKAIKYYLMAGDRARLAYALAEAVNYYQRALAFQKERADYNQAARTLMKLGLAYHIKFDFEKAHTSFDEGFSLWQQAGADADLTMEPAPHPLRLFWSEPISMDPCLTIDVATLQIIQLIFRPLVSVSPDLTILPDLAQRWEVFDNGRRYRFHLSPEACWSDGHPLTAGDVAYSWRRVLASDFPRRSSMLMIKGAADFCQGRLADEEKLGIKVLGDHLLEVEIEPPIGHFLFCLAEPYNFPVPRHVVSVHGEHWTDLDKIVCSGPFMLNERIKQDQMQLIRNPYYFGDRGGNVEEIVLKMISVDDYPDFEYLLDRYNQDEIDLLIFWDSNLFELDKIRQLYASEYVTAPMMDVQFLAFNIHQFPFNNIYLRQAMAHAINREELAVKILCGIKDICWGGFTPPGIPGHIPDLGLTFQPERAVKLMEQAGFPNGKGLPVIDAVSAMWYDHSIIEYLSKQWRDILGIQVNWKLVNVSERRQINVETLQLFFTGWVCDTPDPSFIAVDYGSWKYLWTTEEYKELIEKAKYSVDQDARVAYLQQIDRIMVKQAIVIPLYYGRLHFLIKPWVRRLPVSPMADFYFHEAIIDPH